MLLRAHREHGLRYTFASFFPVSLFVLQLEIRRASRLLLSAPFVAECFFATTPRSINSHKRLITLYVDRESNILFHFEINTPSPPKIKSTRFLFKTCLLLAVCFI